MDETPCVKPCARLVRVLAVGGALAALLLGLGACASDRGDAGARDLLQSTRRDVAQLGLRLDALDRRLDTLDEQQVQRSGEMVARADSIEARLRGAEERAELIGFVRNELSSIKGDVTSLQDESQLARNYRARLVALERRVANASCEPQSIDEIWNHYVAQRDEIERLNDELRTEVPKP